MKDSYSLDLDERLDTQYRAHYDAYSRSSPDAGCQWSPSGAASASWVQRAPRVHVLDAARLRTAVVCATAAVRAEPSGGDLSQGGCRRGASRVRRVETPHATTIESSAACWSGEARTAKIVFLAAEHRSEDGEPVVRLIVAVVRAIPT